MTETPKTFDTLPDIYGSKIESQFAGFDNEVLKEMIAFVKSELKEMGGRVGKTPDTANVLKMLDIFMQRLAANDELKKGGFKNWLTNKIFQVIDLVVQASDPQFANEYPIMLKNMTETGDAATAAKLLVRVVGASAYVGKQEDETLSGRAGRQLYENYESSLIDDLIDRKKELKKSGGWTMADELELPTKDGAMVAAPVGEKVLRVYIKKDPAEEAGLYEQIATDVAVPQTGERPQNCANCGGPASKNPYRGNCEYCGANSLQKTHERKISERLIKRKEAVKQAATAEPVRKIEKPPVQPVAEKSAKANLEISGSSDVTVSRGPYKDILISACSDVDFADTRAQGRVRVSNVSNISGTLTVDSDSKVTFLRASDCDVKIIRVNDGKTPVTGSIEIDTASDVEVTSTHNDIVISGVSNVHFDDVVAYGSVTVEQASDVSGTITFIGGGELKTKQCSSVDVEVVHE